MEDKNVLFASIIRSVKYATQIYEQPGGAEPSCALDRPSAGAPPPLFRAKGSPSISYCSHCYLRCCSYCLAQHLPQISSQTERHRDASRRGADGRRRSKSRGEAQPRAAPALCPDLAATELAGGHDGPRYAERRFSSAYFQTNRKVSFGLETIVCCSVSYFAPASALTERNVSKPIPKRCS